MANKEEVVTKAREFLSAVAREVQARLGTNPRAVEKSVWWSVASTDNSQVIVRSSGTSSLLQSGGHEREVFDSFRVNTLYQVELMHNGFPEQTQLHELITTAGIEAQRIQYGFLLPLVLAWCKLPDPFDLTQQAAQILLDEFAEAVVDGTSVTRYRDVLLFIDIGGTAVDLEDGITVRPIDEEELWELGRGGTLITPFSLQLSPAENWCMLDVELQHSQDDAAQIATTLYAIREAVVANLAMVIESGFTLLPIGITTKFGPNATGTSIHGSLLPRQFGSLPSMASGSIDASARRQLQENWPRVKEAMQSPSNYLGLPLRRLVDGLGRARHDDRIIDYAIGLEALLTKSAQGELSYRFALRGATILGEGGEDKHQAFQELRDFYQARSKIVHGGSVSELDLRALAVCGEGLLRKVWNWYSAQGLTLEGATARIDRQILASE